MIISFVITGVSFSRFSTTITNTGAQNVNDPGQGPGRGSEIEFSTWALDYGATMVSLANMVPGDAKIINIWVSNKDSSGTVSGFNRTLPWVKTTINLPLNYTLKERQPCRSQPPGSLPLCQRSSVLYGRRGRNKILYADDLWPEEQSFYVQK